MTAILPSEVHLDVPLTNLVVANWQSSTNYIADRIFPSLPVAKQSDKYYVWDNGFFNRTGEVKKLAPGVEVEKVSMSLSNDNYFIEPVGLGMDFTTQALGNEDTQLNVRLSGSMTLLNKLRLDRELDFIDNFFATGVWDTEYTGVSGTPTGLQVKQWNDYTDSDPIVDVTTAKTAMHLASGGVTSGTGIVMALTQDVKDKLVNHPQILARINGGATTATPAMVTNQRLAEIFEVDEVLVFQAIQNTAKEGQADANSFVATKKCALYARPAAPGLMVPASGYAFTWNGLEGSNGYGVSIESFSDDELKRRNIAESIRAIMSYQHKLVGSSMGVFFNSIIA